MLQNHECAVGYVYVGLLYNAHYPEKVIENGYTQRVLHLSTRAVHILMVMMIGCLFLWTGAYGSLNITWYFKDYQSKYSRAKNKIVELLFHSFISFNHSLGTLATTESLYYRYGYCLALSRYSGAANPCIAHMIVIRIHFISLYSQSGRLESS